MAPKIRQMRGPGMNKGLKKPRHGKFPTPEEPKTAATRAAAATPADALAAAADNPSYLSGTVVPTTTLSGSGKRRAPSKGKVLSSKTF